MTKGAWRRKRRRLKKAARRFRGRSPQLPEFAILTEKSQTTFRMVKTRRLNRSKRSREWLRHIDVLARLSAGNKLLDKALGVLARKASYHNKKARSAIRHLRVIYRRYPQAVATLTKNAIDAEIALAKHKEKRR